MSNTGFQFGLIVVIFASALILIMALLFMRHRNQQMRHQERLAALEKGVAIPAAASAPWSPRVYLLRGLIWSFTGAALIIALFVASMTSERHYRESAELMAAQARNVSQNLQIPVEQARQIVEKDSAARAAEDTGVPIALALFGLIPLGVGLAYIIFYRSDPSQSVSSRA